MKKNFILVKSVAMATALVMLLGGCTNVKEPTATTQMKGNIERMSINLNNGWKYHKGMNGGMQKEDYDASDWIDISLPHNTSLYTAENKNGYDGKSSYRKEFTLDEKYSGGRVVLNFEGVMQICTVYLNGEKIAEHSNGSTPFNVDITELVRFGEKNLLAVATDSKPNPELTPGNASPDFQYFGGIYRNVSITVTDNIYIGDVISDDIVAGGGVFITAPEVSDESATLNVKTYVHNDTAKKENVTLLTEVIFDGEVVSKQESVQAIASESAYTFVQSVEVKNPSLWSIYSPAMYTVRSTVLVEGKAIDTLDTSYGIRTVEWTHDGLYLNGELMKAQGANLHSDIFVIGNAIPDNEVYEEVRRLKENGFDFIRMSHYPHSDAYYDACDELGVMVLDCMSGWQYYSDSDMFKQSTYDELRTMIRNSRNHPCIVAWETSLNESWYTDEWAATVNDIAHKEYPAEGISRIWTVGWKTDEFDLKSGASQANIRFEGDSSDKGIIISEYGDWDYGGTNSSSRQAREKGDRAMLKQASNHIESLIHNRNKDWYTVDAIWDYADYAGFDAGMNYCGVTDMYRVDKFSAYFYRSQREANVDLSGIGIESGAMVYIANTLSKTSPEDVTVFTNCDEVELYVDGVSIGKQTPDKQYYGPNSGKMISTESLKHPPITFVGANSSASELKAVGYIGGEAVAEYTVKAPKKASALKLVAETDKALCANGSDLRLIWVYVVDENGTVTVDEDAYITLEAENGHVLGYEALNTRGGAIGVWVRAVPSTSDGKITLTAKADGLAEGTVVIPTAGYEHADGYVDVANEYSGEVEGKIEKPVELGENIALGKPVSASSENYNGNIGTESATRAIDGDSGTWWCANNNLEKPHWWMIDLEAEMEILKIVVEFETPVGITYKFTLQGSSDGESWTDIANLLDNSEAGGAFDVDCNEVYRYLRVYSIEADGGRWPAIAEFKVYSGSAN